MLTKWESKGEVNQLYSPTQITKVVSVHGKGGGGADKKKVKVANKGGPAEVCGSSPTNCMVKERDI